MYVPNPASDTAHTCTMLLQILNMQIDTDTCQGVSIAFAPPYPSCQLNLPRLDDIDRQFACCCGKQRKSERNSEWYVGREPRDGCSASPKSSFGRCSSFGSLATWGGMICGQFGCILPCVPVSSFVVDPSCAIVKVRLCLFEEKNLYVYTQWPVSCVSGPENWFGRLIPGIAWRAFFSFAFFEHIICIIGCADGIHAPRPKRY